MGEGKLLQKVGVTCGDAREAVPIWHGFSVPLALPFKTFITIDIRYIFQKMRSVLVKAEKL